METDLNLYLNGTATNQTVLFNSTEGWLNLPPIEVIGMDAVLIYLTILTIIQFMSMWLLMRMVIRHGR